jgi:pimeloyl-ACP methyl ester carboxylesterase
MFRLLAPWVLACGLMASPPAFVKEGKGPGVLLIHGFGGNHGVWDAVAPELAKNHTVVRVDLPGSAGTPGPALVEGAADFEALAKDLAALARREGLVPCLIVGHSMGGPLAALTVLQDPAAFRGLVLVDSFLGVVPATYLDATVAGLDLDPPTYMRAFLGPMTSGPEQTGRVVKEVLQVPVPILKAYLKGMSRDTLKGRQTQLKLPVLLLAAGPEEADAAKREAMMGFMGFKGLPDFRVIPFPKAKHWIMWDEPEAFLAAFRGMEALPK